MSAINQEDQMVQPNGQKPAVTGGPAAPNLNHGGEDNSRPLQTRASHGQERAPSSAGDKVTVACKLPGGMRLRVYQMVPFREPAMGGVTRESEIASRLGDEEVVVHGPACAPDKRPVCIITPEGYALTPGVDRETWELWLHQNAKQPYVLKGLIKALPDEASARDFSRDMAEARSGMEPLEFEPGTDPRVPRAAASNVGGITVSDDNKAKPGAI